MATAVSICSNALVLLGNEAISDLTGPPGDLGVDARRCAKLFPFTRDAMIRSHNWSSCIKRVQLAPVNDAPVFGYSYAFTLPGDCLRILSITDDEYPLDHRIEGQQILTNIKPISLRYVFRNEIVESWDAGLVDVMTSAMCAALAFPVTRNPGIKQAYDQEVFIKLRAARAVDSQQNTHQGIISSPLVEVRGVS